MIGISFGSCDADEEIISNSSKYNDEISFEHFKRETGLSNFRTKISINPSLENVMARTANGDYELSDFSISTEIIKKLEISNLTSYTFRVFPNEIFSEKETSVFNLSLIKKGLNWETLLLEFRPTPANLQAIESGITEQIEGDAKILYQGDYVNNTYVSSNEAMRCVSIVVKTTHCNGRGFCAGGECDECPQCVSYDTTYPCAGGGGGGGGGLPPVDPIGGGYPNLAVGGSGAGGYSTIHWIPINSITNPYLENPVVANVRSLDDDFDNEIPNNPCENLKKLISTDDLSTQSPNLKSKIEDVKTFAASSIRKEVIYSLAKDANGNYSTSNLVISESYNSSKPEFGGDIYGSIHSHWYDLYPIFSWSDVFNLRTSYYEASSVNKSETTIMMAGKECLTCENVVVYALKIDDWNTFRAKIMGDYGDPITQNYTQKEKMDYKDRQFSKKFKLNMNTQQLEKLFLENFADYGISLYKATDELNNWNKLSLSGNPLSPITNTPCN